MENKKNYTPIIITFGIIVFVLLVGAYYIGKSSNNQTQNNQIPAETSVQTPATQPDQTETQAPAQSSQSQCDTDAKAYMAKQWKLNDYEGYKTLSLTYDSHYNKSNNACYVLVKYNFEFTGLSTGVSYTLANVSTKNIYGFATTVGNYQSDKFPDGTSNLLACDVEGAQCFSADGFLTLTKPYMGE